MKKKISLSDLKVSSFVTGKAVIKGGTNKDRERPATLGEATCYLCGRTYNCA